MIAWRITKSKRASDLSGHGAALEGGRWNDIDVPALYMGLTPAISCLETFVHAGAIPTLPLKITRFTLPDDQALFHEPEPVELPEGWQSVPADRPSMSYGTSWLRAGKHLGLIVPSAVLPLERNIVINPAHPAVKEITIDEQFDFMYDERMFSRRR